MTPSRDLGSRGVKLPARGQPVGAPALGGGAVVYCVVDGRESCSDWFCGHHTIEPRAEACADTMQLDPVSVTFVVMGR